jgi:hypothetical protein
VKREELEHVLRAAAAITTDTSFVVIGSQAVLLTHPQARDKDADWVRALLHHRLIEFTQLKTRLRALDAPLSLIDKYLAWANRRAQEANPP